MTENKNKYITSDEVAKLLVELYAAYTRLGGCESQYALAVGIAIKALTD